MTQAPAEPAAPPAQLSCPSCGSPAAPDQLLCLECGNRLALRYRRPPSWRLPAAVIAAVALVAGAGLAIGLAQVGDDAERVARAPSPTVPGAAQQPGAQPGTPPAGSPPAAAPGDAGATTEPAPGTGTSEPPAPDEQQADGEVASWPPSTSAYTVILLSADNRAGAEATAREAIAQGLEGGVLRSDDYESLNAGYWVAYAGSFESQDEAQEEAQRAASLGFAGAYVRFVSGDR